MKNLRRLLGSGTLVALALVTASVGLVAPAKTWAVTGGQWQAGHIIDDSVFYNSGSMGASQIQQFLNAKVPVCDTNGTQIYSGVTRQAYSAARGIATPFICLKNYYENPATKENNLGGTIPAGAISAAQIIYNASQAYAVNPQVLLVLLQKEQTLVTDDWPWPVQYQKATGYGCPDTAACDSQYYGFYNQVTNAARQFRRYATNPRSYNYLAGANNNILYNPTVSCGSPGVYIQNQATAALYNYTPYQPNGAALSNLYGNGDSCSAYGNRNFWRLFSDWFGSTYGGAISGIVTRLYNPLNGDYMLLVDSKDIDAARRTRNYWMSDGEVFEGYPSFTEGSVPVYQLAKNDGTHLYALSGTELDNALANGYSNDGVKFYVKTTADGTNRPVYRLSQNGRYFYTVNIFEKQNMITRGFSDDGIVFYAPSYATSAPVYRLNYRGTHLFTQNTGERDVALRGGNVDEGIAFNAQTAPTTDAMPVFRLVKNGKYIFTEDKGERDALVLMYGYESEGAGFYGYPSGYAGTTPIYRANRGANPEDHLYSTDPIEASIVSLLYGYNTKVNAFNE
jgi:hypothetical protein